MEAAVANNPTYLRGGDSLSIEEDFVIEFLRISEYLRMLDQVSFVNMWSQVFGKEKIQVLSFERLVSLGGDFSVNMLEHMAEIRMDLDEQIIFPSRANESISLEWIKLFAYDLDQSGLVRSPSLAHWRQILDARNKGLISMAGNYRILSSDSLKVRGITVAPYFGTPE